MPVPVFAKPNFIKLDLEKISEEQSKQEISKFSQSVLNIKTKPMEAAFIDIDE
jgi:hypothetical protein